MRISFLTEQKATAKSHEPYVVEVDHVIILRISPRIPPKFKRVEVDDEQYVRGPRSSFSY